MKVENKRAAITGGAAGIGRAIALELATRGCDVVVADVESDSAAAVAEEVRSRGRRSIGAACDVTDRASIEALADRAWSEWGGVDLLFNNAGVGAGSPLLVASADDLRWTLEVNLIGLWQGCAVFGSRMAAQSSPAWICNTGSEHSLGFAHPGMGFYTASKHAVLGLSDVLRHELPPHVGVSVLCPGMVRTRFWEATRNRPERFGGRQDGEALSQQIMERGMDPEELGRRAVDGVEAGEFLIPTHAQAIRYAETRWKEIAAAFERQAPYRKEDERYDVNSALQELFGGGR